MSQKRRSIPRSVKPVSPITIIMKIAVFLPNWLGDVVMATPTLRALRKHFGGETQIVGIMRPYLRHLLDGTDWLDAQRLFHPKSTSPELRQRALIRWMRAERFDLAVLLLNTLRSAVLARMGGATEIVGHVRYGRGPLLTQKVPVTGPNGGRSARPMVDYYLELARAIGCPAESQRLELATTEKDERLAERVWRRLGLRADGKVVAVNCSGAYGGSKLWPVEYFSQLARQIVDRIDRDVLVMCGPNEQETAKRIVDGSGRRRVFSMAEQPLDLGTAKACVRRTELVVSTDSGPRHLAAALGKPVVTLFGPMLPIWSKNPTQQTIDLMLDLDCIGCHKRICPHGHHRCMRDLSVDRVFAAVDELLQRKHKEHAA